MGFSLINHPYYPKITPISIPIVLLNPQCTPTCSGEAAPARSDCQGAGSLSVAVRDGLVEMAQTLFLKRILLAV